MEMTMNEREYFKSGNLHVGGNLHKLRGKLLIR